MLSRSELVSEKWLSQLVRFGIRLRSKAPAGHNLCRATTYSYGGWSFGGIRNPDASSIGNIVACRDCKDPISKSLYRLFVLLRTTYPATLVTGD